jgi:hypothetical protein
MRVEDRWQFAVAIGRDLVQAMLIDSSASTEVAKREVAHELAMTFGVALVGSWTISNRAGWWRATLWPIPQAD